MSDAASPRFLQIHFLTSYPASLLNRDDAGFAKRIPFGGASRTRISSQCLKRHWRRFEGEGSLRDLQLGGEPVPFAVRSRRTFEKQVYEPLKAEGVSEEIAEAITQALMGVVLQKSEKAAAREAEGEGEGLRTGQVIVLGRPEVDFLLEQAREVAREIEDPKKAKAAVEARFKGEPKKNLATLTLGAGLDAALFGRMVTSDILARADAPVHVAHAFTVHEEAAETDYFSAVDDLAQEMAETGSGHIGTTELTSGLFYGYVAVDVPLLVSNLQGCRVEEWTSADRDLAAGVLERLVHMVATVSPGAKLGSTAPHSYAHLVLTEAGDAQPRTLANAFLDPVRENGRGGLVKSTYAALAKHLADLDRMYGAAFERCHAAMGPLDALEPALAEDSAVSLSELATWTGARVRG